MADYASGLPVRSEADGTDERVHVKIVDGTTPSQMATVDTDGLVHIENHGNDPTGADVVQLMSELGHAAIDGFYDATNNTDPSNIGLIAHTRAVAPADTDQIKKLTAITNASVHALDISLHDHNGANYSPTNPVPVYIQEGAGLEVNNYDTQSALIAAAVDNHDYTVPAAPNGFIFKRIIASASGKMKVEVQVDIGAGYVTIAVGFNSTPQPQVLGIEFAPVQLAATDKIRLIRTNKDNQPQDVYSTIIGVILP